VRVIVASERACSSCLGVYQTDGTKLIDSSEAYFAFFKQKQRHEILEFYFKFRSS